MAEKLSWSWRQGLLKGAAGAATGFGAGLILWMAGGMAAGITFGATFASLLALGTAVALGFLGGLSADVVDDRAFPNQGIRHSWKNALRVFAGIFFMSGSAIGLAIWFAWERFFGMERGAWAGLSSGLGAGFALAYAVALVYGGFAVLQHYLIRAGLVLSGQLPWDLAGLLNRAAERYLVRRVGGGYMFCHKLVQDHLYLASMDSDDKRRSGVDNG